MTNICKVNAIPEQNPGNRSEQQAMKTIGK